MNELEKIVADATQKTKRIKSKLERDRKEVYYLEDTEDDYLQLNPLKHAYGILEIEDEKSNVYRVHEWVENAVFGFWVFDYNLYDQKQAEFQVKAANKEHNTY